MTKMIGFRPSDKALEKLEAYMKKHGISKSYAINQILESEQPQLEQPKKEDEGDFFELPPVLFCPLTNRWVLKEELIKSSKGCKDCLKKPKCPAYRREKALNIILPNSASRTYRQAHTLF